MGENELETSLRNSTLKAMKFAGDGALVSSSKEETREYEGSRTGEESGVSGNIWQVGRKGENQR